MKRKLISIESPAAEPGFLGKGHTARAVLNGNFAQSDPFILLMDDMLDKQDGEPAGGPHPHAGFETVSLLLEGTMGDSRHMLKDGDLQLMTAGSGIVHSETIDTKKKMRLLQLWISLPKKDRWTTPRVQDLSFERAPFLDENGTKIRLYSGSFAGLTSPVKNYANFILADIHLDAGSTLLKELPASYNAFLYVIDGSLKVGEENKLLKESQTGWLNTFSTQGTSELILNGGEKGARVILYAGEPTGDQIVSYGPFIGDTQEDIRRLYKDYRENKMKHISSVSNEQIFSF
ncbi:pimeloyl-CoA dehydrogenase [Sphingobacteriaceae bacterium]|nr:pimeloyl-CoA dehydrogenase [Sphingobacteriaceae bacterium]